MGAYLSEPVLEKVSEKGEKNGLCFGASAVQGWRVGMEDAHCCLPDFDDETFMFGVYDGHGGAEVAEYTSKNLAEVIKSMQSYKDGNLRQCLIDAFLQMDKNFTTEEVMADLRELAGFNKGDCDEDEDEAEMLAQEASMPLSELLEKMKKAVKKDEESNEDDEDSENEELNDGQKNGVEKNEKTKNGEDKETKKNGASSKQNHIDEGPSKEDVSEKEEKSVNEEKGERSAANDDDDKDDGFEEAEEESDEEESGEDEDDGGDEEEEDDDEDDDLPNGVIAGQSDEVAYDSGTTAVVALLKGNHLVVSNVGDSRCVLSRSGIAIDMSVDHKPEDEKEFTRITEAGGKVTKDGRVNGGLNLSRALGDHSYKLKVDLPPEKQQITAMPDIKETTLTESDEFMVLACDGIWNVKNSQDVVDFVSQKIKKQKESGELDLEKICEDLFDECMAPDTSGDGTGCDNMTCIVVVFDKNKPFVNVGKSKRKVSECLEQEQPDKKQKVELKVDDKVAE